MFPLAGAGLLRQPSRLLNGELAKATLLPMFDQQGQVEQLLLVDHDSQSLTLLNWKPGLVEKPLLRVVRLKITTVALDGPDPG